MSNRQFRKASWGMTKLQVRQTEDGMPFGETDDSLVYNDTLVGYQCQVFFRFKGDGLVSSAYVFDDEDVVDVRNYFEIKKILTEKYGAPTFDHLAWKNELKKPSIETYADLANAVAAGYVNLASNWRSPDTEINLALTAEKGRMNAHLLVLYSSIGDKTAAKVDSRTRDYEIL